jgi:hypothetical protein
MEAAITGQEDIIKILIDHNCDVTTHDKVSKDEIKVDKIRQLSCVLYGYTPKFMMNATLTSLSDAATTATHG